LAEYNALESRIRSEQVTLAELQAEEDAAVDSPEGRRRAAAKIPAQERHLVALQKQRGALGERMLGCLQGMVLTMPDHRAQAFRRFAGEWSDGLRIWNQLLGKRRALELSLGGTMSLPQPEAIAVDADIPEIEPYLLSQNLEGALKRCLADLSAAGFDHEAQRLNQGYVHLVLGNAQRTHAEKARLAAEESAAR